MASRAFMGNAAKTELIDETIPYSPHSNEYLETMIRKTASTIYHPVGTTKMGPSTDPLAVVDPELCVIGLTGLRVADASVMPTITCGNTNAPVAVIAEKAADIIRAHWA